MNNTKGVEDGITDEQAVKTVYPDAKLVGYHDGACAIFSSLATLSENTGYLGWGQATFNRNSAQADREAWADARSKLPIRSATPEELTAQAESLGKNYKPGPRQATPFMPERIGDHINCPKHGLKFGFCEECVESPEELPHMQGNETKAVSDLLNSMKVIDRHQRYQECRSDVLTKLMYELAALRENMPTLPVPERTAEMEELLYSALARLRRNAQHIFDANPVRDWCETLAEADAALEAYKRHIEGKG